MSLDPFHRVRSGGVNVRGRRALFLDRDGTIIDDPGYIDDPDKVRLIPGAVAALRRFRDAGHALVLVTNQSGIGRGYYGWDAYETVAVRLRTQLETEGVSLDAELACGHAPEEDCTWRKPKPGMVLEAARLLDLDLKRSVMVGDKLSDLLAAETAGIGRGIHVLTGHGRAERPAVKAWKPKLALDFLDDLATLPPCGS